MYTKRSDVVKKDSSSGAASDKLKYIVMIQTRISMTYGAARYLQKCVAIAIRYSAVRLQGFVNTREDSISSGEHPVLNYQVRPHGVVDSGLCENGCYSSR